MKKSNTKKSTKSKMTRDLKKVEIPLDLDKEMSMVVGELIDKGFRYSHTTNTTIPMLTFESKDEKILIDVNKGNLLIRQFSMTGDASKLKILYVVTPSERGFKLL